MNRFPEHANVFKEYFRSQIGTVENIPTNEKPLCAKPAKNILSHSITFVRIILHLNIYNNMKCFFNFIVVSNKLDSQQIYIQLHCRT